MHNWDIKDWPSDKQYSWNFSDWSTDRKPTTEHLETDRKRTAEMFETDRLIGNEKLKLKGLTD